MLNEHVYLYIQLRCSICFSKSTNVGERATAYNIIENLISIAEENITFIY